MIEINLKANIDEVIKGLSLFERTQVPWAMSLTIARLGNQAKDAVQAKMEEVFDRPTPFTRKGVRVAWISKDPDNLRFRVFLNEWAAKGTAPVRYLFPEVEGGERNETRFERSLRFAGRLPAGMSVVPGKGAPLDAYGNVRNGVASSVLSQVRASTDPYQNETKRSRKRAGADRMRYFVGKPGGGRLPLGIYQRVGRDIWPIYLFVQSRPTYRKRLPFYEVVQQVYDAQFEPTFRKAFEDAMRTAR